MFRSVTNENLNQLKLHILASEEHAALKLTQQITQPSQVKLLYTQFSDNTSFLQLALEKSCLRLAYLFLIKLNELHTENISIKLSSTCLHTVILNQSISCDNLLEFLQFFSNNHRTDFLPLVTSTDSDGNSVLQIIAENFIQQLQTFNIRQAFIDQNKYYRYLQFFHEILLSVDPAEKITAANNYNKNGINLLQQLCQALQIVEAKSSLSSTKETLISFISTILPVSNLNLIDNELQGYKNYLLTISSQSQIKIFQSIYRHIPERFYYLANFHALLEKQQSNWSETNEKTLNRSKRHLYLLKNNLSTVKKSYQSNYQSIRNSYLIQTAILPTLLSLLSIASFVLEYIYDKEIREKVSPRVYMILGSLTPVMAAIFLLISFIYIKVRDALFSPHLSTDELSLLRDNLAIHLSKNISNDLRIKHEEHNFLTYFREMYNRLGQPLDYNEVYTIINGLNEKLSKLQYTINLKKKPLTYFFAVETATRAATEENHEIIINIP